MHTVRFVGRFLEALESASHSLNLLAHFAMLVMVCALLAVPPSYAQTGSTGALTGTVTDPSGAAVSVAQVVLISDATGEKHQMTTNADGTYVIPLLLPGKYKIQISQTGFNTATRTGVVINVTETAKLNVQLQVGSVSEEVTVSEAAEELVQTETMAEGRLTSGEVTRDLPLVTRNYTQVIGLSPGVATEITNAGELGAGSSGMSGGTTAFLPGLEANGARPSDNNFQMNGVEVNDYMASGSFTGGAPIPNPDTIQEFKVQTSLYDAAYGRDAGANVNVVTKGGTSSFHGNIFEFFRNEDLNANDFFRNMAGLGRPILRQNQPGGTVGGPILKDKLFFFSSYQYTNQLNGESTGLFGCSTSFGMPPLTNDRSAAAIGKLFAGQAGANGGAAIAPDGSNVNPIALTLLNYKLPDGSYLIPTPQTVDPSKPFLSRGFFTASIPCTYTEHQATGDIDYIQSTKSRFSERFFMARDVQVNTLSATNVGGPTMPGFPYPTRTRYWAFSLTHDYTISPTLVNQAEFGFHRTFEILQPTFPFGWSDIGVNAPSFDNKTPVIQIVGAFTTGGNGQTVGAGENGWTVQDSLSWVHGPHDFRFGGGLTRGQINFRFTYLSELSFLSFPDFLLGESAAQNGSPFSNIFSSLDGPGFFDRDYRIWWGNAYGQDTWKVTRKLTLNLGFRYERLGDLGDAAGRNGNFWFSLANPNPPGTGTLAGFVVPSNYSGGAIPAGVTQLGNDLGIRGNGQNTFGPRVGFSWQFAKGTVLRGGYGFYYSALTGQQFLQLITTPPFSLFRVLTGTNNAGASFANPFPAGAPNVPSFPAYSPSTFNNSTVWDPNYVPGRVQQFSLNVQRQFGRDFLLQVGYVGTRGTSLIRGRDLNQAGLASATDPIRGLTTNTVANIQQRVPIEGWTSTGISQLESAGESWYNSLQTSLTKRVSRGLYFLASYTFSRDYDSDAQNVTLSSAGGSTTGNQSANNRVRYGRVNFSRDNRFVFSYVYDFPHPKKSLGAFAGNLLGGWHLAGVTIVQSGQPLSILATNANNIFGVTTDQAQFAPGCTAQKLVTSGSVTSKLNNYFNKNCLTPNFPIIGNDGIGTAFGNSGVGIVNGPAETNFDISLIKSTPVRWPRDGGNFEFRTEFFNAFNTPQFGNPDTNFSSPTFGQVLSTVVNPRILQFALKFNF
jgi:hypothetical protein